MKALLCKRKDKIGDVLIAIQNQFDSDGME